MDRGMKTSSIHSAKQHNRAKSIAFHEARQNQTLTLAGRESSTRIIPMIILCLVLDFQECEKNISNKRLGVQGRSQPVINGVKSLLST